MSKVGIIMKVVNGALNIKRRLNRSLFDKPSFYIKGTSRYGYDADTCIEVVNKEDTYFIVEKIFFETLDGAKSELKYTHKMSELTIKIPSEDQYYGVNGVIRIEYMLKNKSRYSATSPEIVTAEKYNEELEKEIPLNIINDIYEKYFT